MSLLGYFKNRKHNRVNSGSFALLDKMTQRLSDMKPGQGGVIQEFQDETIFLKLMEMGCVPGEKIHVEQVAPLGDPMSITIAGYRLSLRLNEAEHILVDTRY